MANPGHLHKTAIRRARGAKNTFSNAYYDYERENAGAAVGNGRKRNYICTRKVCPTSVGVGERSGEYHRVVQTIIIIHCHDNNSY